MLVKVGLAIVRIQEFERDMASAKRKIIMGVWGPFQGQSPWLEGQGGLITQWSWKYFHNKK